MTSSACKISSMTFFSKLIIVTSLVAPSLTPVTAQQVQITDARIQDTIHAWLSKGNAGDVSLYAQNLDTGSTYALNADAPTPTASTIKLPVMIELFTEVAAGKLDWEKKIELRDKDKVTGSGLLQQFSGGDQFTLHDLMVLMIDISDNTATNLVLDQVNGNDVNARMTALGLKQTAVMRHIMQSRVFPGLSPEVFPGAKPPGQTIEGAKPENLVYGTGKTCPHDMVILLNKLYHGQLVSKSASDEMLDVMKHQIYHSAGRDMPDYQIASKSGSLDHFRSDVAIIYTPHGAIAMAITVNNIPKANYADNNPGEVLISDLSDVLVDALATPIAK